jgi:hypothetical protein
MSIPSFTPTFNNIFQIEIDGTQAVFENERVPIQFAVNYFMELYEKEESRLSNGTKSIVLPMLQLIFHAHFNEKQKAKIFSSLNLINNAFNPVKETPLKVDTEKDLKMKDEKKLNVEEPKTQFEKSESNFKDISSEMTYVHFCEYVYIEDHVNIIRTGKECLLQNPKLDDKVEILHNIAFSYLELGDPKQAYSILHQLTLEVAPLYSIEPIFYYYLALASIIAKSEGTHGQCSQILTLGDIIVNYRQNDPKFLHKFYVYLLGAFEVMLKTEDKSPEFIQDLKKLSGMLKYKGWKQHHKTRYGACLLALTKLLAPKA